MTCTFVGVHKHIRVYAFNINFIRSTLNVAGGGVANPNQISSESGIVDNEPAALRVNNA